MNTKEFNPESNFAILLSNSNIIFEYGKKYDLLDDSTSLGYAILQDDKREDGFETIRFFLNQEIKNFNYRPMADTLTGVLHFIDAFDIDWV